jgi:hypothetical protein
MKEKIDKLLSQKAPLKARDIARGLEFEPNRGQLFPPTVTVDFEAAGLKNLRKPLAKLHTRAAVPIESIAPMPVVVTRPVIPR